MLSEVQMQQVYRREIPHPECVRCTDEKGLIGLIRRSTQTECLHPPTPVGHNSLTRSTPLQQS